MFRFMMHHRKSSRGRAYPLVLGGLLATTLLLTGSAANAQTVWFESGTPGSQYAAKAEFFNDTANSQWTLKLYNLGSAATVNGDVLSGLFWQGLNTNFNVGKTATVAGVLQNDDGSAYTQHFAKGQWVTNTAAQHWAYRNGMTVDGIAGNFNQGVGVAGFSDGSQGFGDPDVLAPGGSSPLLNGVDWGIVSGFGPGGLTNDNQNPFIIGSATFTFQGPIDVSQISAVRFQYGSGLNQTSMISTVRQNRQPVVPEGDGVLLLLAGGLPLVGMMIHRRKKMSGNVA